MPRPGRAGPGRFLGMTPVVSVRLLTSILEFYSLNSLAIIHRLFSLCVNRAISISTRECKWRPVVVATSYYYEKKQTTPPLLPRSLLNIAERQKSIPLVFLAYSKSGIPVKLFRPKGGRAGSEEGVACLQRALSAISRWQKFHRQVRKCKI